MIGETARAKINLALHVRRRRADGYHEIETLFAFTEAGDRLSAEAADDLSLQITGPFAGQLTAGPDNLVLRAAAALRDAAGIAAGARLLLDKQLPVAAGIGGGSADAAATLKMLARLWDIDPAATSSAAIAARLGADVPACLTGGILFGSGIGERLTPVAISGLAGTPVLLANPGTVCPTGAVFARWDGRDRGALDPADWTTARNDLTAPAVALVPEIATLIDLLAKQDGARHARMSGSGATCLALFASDAACLAARDAIAAAMPAAWLAATRIAP